MGLDTNDMALFDSAFTDDAVLDLNGRVLKGIDELNTGCFDFIANLETTHFVSNVRVNVKPGDTEASGTAYSLAYHYRKGTEAFPAPKASGSGFTTGNLYFFDCVKDDKDGLWKATHWRLQSLWAEGDHEVMTRK